MKYPTIWPVYGPNPELDGLVYGLVDPREPNRIRYVGQTEASPEKRYRRHVYGRNHGDYPSKQWLRDLAGDGVLPQMVLLAMDSAEESAWIGRLAKLGEADLNIHGSPRVSEYLSEKQRAAQKRKPARPVKRAVALTLSVDVLRRLDAEAKRLERSRSYVISQAIEPLLREWAA